MSVSNAGPRGTVRNAPIPRERAPCAACCAEMPVPCMRRGRGAHTVALALFFKCDVSPGL